MTWAHHEACEVAAIRHIGRVHYRAEWRDLYQEAALRVLRYPNAPDGAAAHRGVQDFVQSLDRFERGCDYGARLMGDTPLSYAEDAALAFEAQEEAQVAAERRAAARVKLRATWARLSRKYRARHAKPKREPKHTEAQRAAWRERAQRYRDRQSFLRCGAGGGA